MSDDLADDRWTVRGVSKGVRDAAAEAARRRKISVGAWLALAVDLAITAEREPMDLILPRAADKSSDTSDVAARVSMVERVVASAVALAGAPDVPMGLRRRANRLLRESLSTVGQHAAAADRPRLIAGGAGVAKEAA